MELTVEEASLIQHFDSDKLLAKIRDRTPRTLTHILDQVRVKLTIDQASFLYEKLSRVFVHPPQNRPETARKNALTYPLYLLGVLDKRLYQMRQTAPVSRPAGKVVRFLPQGLTLELRPYEAAYLLRILANKKRDKWRRENQERKHFVPLKVVEIAEEGEAEEGPRRPFFRPVDHENPDAQMRRAVLKKALGELPKKLKMPAEDVDTLLGALTNAEGNVSEAARQLGQPQRKTARQIQRIIRHLKSRGFSA